MRLLPVFAVLLGLSACGDPLSGVDRLSDVDVVQTDPSAAALPDAKEIAREGFFGTSAAQGDPSQQTAAPEATSPEKRRGGFLGGLIQRAATADPAAAVAADVAQAQSQDGTLAPQASEVPAEAPTELAALPPPNDTAPKRGRLGLLRGGPPKKDAVRKGPDARDVAYGGTLAFGEIARVCEARNKSMGKKVDGQGRRGFTLYDSNPGIRDKRTFYVTGFDDGCPRQFTAANALFGAPSFYEQIRFGPAGKHLPYAATDKAYDKVKKTICRVGKKKPCGNKIATLDKGTAFVSAYEFNEHNGKWKEFLVHDGAVLASAVKSFN